VVDYLWRAGKVPEWIDAAVEAQDAHCSLIGLRCCGRFTASEELLYHRPGGLAPFSIKSPVLPPGWENIEVSGRFDLYWRHTQTGARSWSPFGSAVSPNHSLQLTRRFLARLARSLRSR
jgi:hypothetical protein